MANVFYFDSYYDNFNPYTDRVKFETIYGSTFIVVFAIAAFMLSAFTLVMPYSRSATYTLAGLFILSTAVIIHWIIVLTRYRMLVRQGILLDGEIISAELVDPLRLNVTYQFITPTFEVIKSSVSRMPRSVGVPNRLLRAPEPGTPVKVLFANRRNFAAL